MDVTPPAPPPEPPPSSTPLAGQPGGPPLEPPPPPPSGWEVGHSEGPARADAGRLVELAVVVAAVLLLRAFAPLVPVAFVSGGSDFMNIGFVLHRVMAVADALAVLVAIVAVLRSRRAASSALVGALVVVGIAPLLAGVVQAATDMTVGLPMFGLLGTNAIAAWFPAVLATVVVVEVRAALPVVLPSWRTTMWLTVVAGAAALISSAVFAVMAVGQGWFGGGFASAYRFGGSVVAVVLSAIGLVAWSLMMLAAIHAGASAARTRAAAADATYVPVARPGVGALVVGAVALLALVQLGFTVLRGYF